MPVAPVASIFLSSAIFAVSHNYFKDLKQHKKRTEFSLWEWVQKKILCHEPKEVLGVCTQSPQVEIQNIHARVSAPCIK